jgi:hypothetical protein
MNVSFGKVIEVSTKNSDLYGEVASWAVENDQQVSIYPIPEKEDGFHKALVFTEREKKAWDTTQKGLLLINTNSGTSGFLSDAKLNLVKAFRSIADKVEIKSLSDVKENAFDMLA